MDSLTLLVIQIKISEIRNLGCERKKKWEIKKRNQRKERKKKGGCKRWEVMERRNKISRGSKTNAKYVDRYELGKQKDTPNCGISSQFPIIIFNCLLIKCFRNWTFNSGTSPLLMIQLLMCWVLWNVNRNWYHLSSTSICFNLLSVHKRTSTFTLTVWPWTSLGCFWSWQMSY